MLDSILEVILLNQKIRDEPLRGDNVNPERGEMGDGTNGWTFQECQDTQGHREEEGKKCTHCVRFDL
jgi:hypothetical protein